MRAILFVLLLTGGLAHASSTVIKQIDTLSNTTGGSSLSVPSTGTTLATDTNTLTLTNKSISGSTNTITNVSLTTGVTGVLPAANGGFGTWTQEVPSGTCNGSTTSFTLANTPAASASVQLHLDGLMLTQGSGKDYTISGATITLTTACSTGQSLWAVYVH